MRMLDTSPGPLTALRRSHDLRQAARLASSLAATVLRGGAGTWVVELGARAQEPLVLYEMEACPFSRKVREALSMLDIDVLCRPCPEGAEHHRRELERERGEQKVPFLIDPNTKERLAESDDIVRYLFDTYGNDRVPLQLALGGLTQRSSELASWARRDAGAEAIAASIPEQPLELWSYEGSPSCRLVRERLSAYALPFLVHNVARLSPRRGLFVERGGRMQVPYLYDPNTGVEMFGAQAIRAYLEQRYAVGSSPGEPGVM